MRAAVRVDGNGGLLKERQSGRSGSITGRLEHTACIVIYDGSSVWVSEPWGGRGGLIYLPRSRNHPPPVLHK